MLSAPYKKETMAPPVVPMIERLADKIMVGDDCWEWTAGKDRDGYGQLHVSRPEGDSSARAHRVVYELLVGPIPEGLTLDHLCRNRGCVKPSHLDPVTVGDNIRRGETGKWQRRS